MKLSLEVFGAILILLSFLPLIKTHYRFIRVLDFPRVQIAFSALITLVIYVCIYSPATLSEVIFAFLLGLALLNEGLHIYKFTILYPVQALRSKIKAPRNSFSIMVSNVRMSNTRFEKFLRVVRENDPDILRSFFQINPDETLA